MTNVLTVNSNKRPSDSQDELANKKPNKALSDKDVPPLLAEREQPYNKIAGKICLACMTKKCPKNVALPFIKIGKYKSVMVCKKQHLTDEKDLCQICEAIDYEVEKCRRTNDAPPKFMMTDDKSGEVMDVEHTQSPSPEVVHKCDGFVNGNLDEKCGKATDAILHFIDGTGKHHFCCTKHLLRYLLKYQCGQGKRSGNSNNNNTNSNTNIIAVDDNHDT